MKTYKVLLLVTIFLLPTYMIRFSIFSVPTNLLEVLAVLSLISFFTSNKNFHRKVSYFFKENRFFCFSLIILLFSLFLSFIFNNPSKSGAGIIKSWFIIPMSFSFVVLFSIKTKNDLINIIKVFYFSILAVSVIGIFYKLEGYLTYDFRLRAFYLSPNHLAMYLAPGLIIGPYFALESLKKKSFLYLWILSLIPLGLSFYFTHSKAALISILIIFLIIISIRIKTKKLYKLGLIFIICFILLVIFGQFIAKYNNLSQILTEKSSFSSRIEIWRSSIIMIKDSPLLGIGPGNFQQKYLEYQRYFPPYQEWAVPQPHNIFLAFWLQTGLLGLISLIYMLYIWLLTTIKLLKIKKYAFMAIPLLTLFYYLIHGLVDTPYWKNDLSFVFWIMIFIVFSAYKIYPEKENI